MAIMRPRPLRHNETLEYRDRLDLAKGILCALCASDRMDDKGGFSPKIVGPWAVAMADAVLAALDDA